MLAKSLPEFKARVKASQSFRCSLQNAEVAYDEIVLGPEIMLVRGFGEVCSWRSCSILATKYKYYSGPSKKKPKYAHHSTMQMQKGEQSCSMNGQHFQLISILAAAHCSAVANCTVPPIAPQTSVAKGLELGAAFPWLQLHE